MLLGVGQWRGRGPAFRIFQEAILRHSAIVGLVLLTSCSGLNLNGVSPDVDYEVLVAATRDCSVPPSSSSTPENMMTRGFTKVNMACEAFFVDATRAQQDALFSNRSLDAVQIATAAILGATASPTAAFKTLAITAAGVVLAKEVINQSTNIFAFNTHLYKVRELTKAAMSTYKATAESNPPANYCKAYDYVVEYATMCSLASMKLLLDQQVAIPSTPVNNTPAATAGFVESLAVPTRSGTGLRSGRALQFRQPRVSPSTSFSVRPL
jgi:hypothetical protein